jgi:hypothetical protein
MFVNFIPEFGIPKKLVRLVKMCLTETYSRVRVGKNVSEMFPIRSGLKQGDALSPLLFNFALEQCFPTAGPRPGTGPWNQLYRAARGKYYRGNILRRIIFVNVSKSSDPERLNNICVANVSDQAAYC